ncbi:MAG: LPS assembly lipoprotein LptE [Bacteroidetes bacterium]|nr:LPS assembly lipoprotein LptE [Bacteroidota bacterium]
MKNYLLKYLFRNKTTILLAGLMVFFVLPFTSCGIYTMNDVSINYDSVKTIKLFTIENKASYVNPQLSPKLYEKLSQKFVNSTKLTRTNNDDAHYQITATITGYNPSQTVGISAQQATTNRLTVSVHVVLKKTLENKSEEFDVSRSADFSANLSLQQAEGQLLDELVRNLTDEIFNHIFSNW